MPRQTWNVTDEKKIEIDLLIKEAKALLMKIKATHAPKCNSKYMRGAAGYTRDVIQSLNEAKRGTVLDY